MHGESTNSAPDEPQQASWIRRLVKHRGLGHLVRRRIVTTRPIRPAHRRNRCRLPFCDSIEVMENDLTPSIRPL